MKDYQKTQSTGESFAVDANDGSGANIEVLTADKTLSAKDSGKTFILKSAAGKAITYPAAALVSGFKAKFIVGLAFATTAWTITAASKKIQGTVVVNGASVLGANEDIITFAHAAENVGDWVEVVSDGTNIYVTGVGSAASSITLTAS